MRARFITVNGQTLRIPAPHGPCLLVFMPLYNPLSFEYGRSCDLHLTIQCGKGDEMSHFCNYSSL